MTAEKSTMGDEDLRTLSDLSIYNCIRFGPYTALIYEDHAGAGLAPALREYSNMDLAREAAQVAKGLQALDIQKGDRVIVMMLNCPEVIIAYQAIARAGGVIIPVMPLLKGPEVRYIAQNSAAKAVITSAILLPLLRNALADVPTMKHIISTGIEGEERDEARPYTIHAYNDIMDRGAAY